MSGETSEPRIGEAELSEFRMHLLDRLAAGDVTPQLIIESIKVLERAGFSMREDEEYMSRMLG